MLPLALIQHDLCIRAHRGRTYWWRAGVAAFGVAVGGGILLAANHTSGTPRAIGPGSAALTWPIAFACLLHGVRLTSDSLSREHRDGTLGLLFLTGLRPLGIVLARLFQATLRAWSGLLALTPALALLGFVQGRELGALPRLVLALGCIQFLGLSLGLAASSLTRDRKRSESIGGAVVVFAWVALPLAHQVIITSFPGWPSLLNPILINPFMLVSQALYLVPRGSTDPYWLSLILVGIEAAAFLAIAAWRLGRSWRKSEDAGGVERPARNRRGIGHRPDREFNHRQRLMDSNPFRWLAAREARSPLLLHLGMGLFAVLAAASAWWTGDASVVVSQSLFVTLGLWYPLIKVFAAEGAGHVLHAQRSLGAFEFLLVTPLSVQEILRGHRLALWDRFRWPIAAFLGIAAVLVVVCLASPDSVAIGTGPAHTVVLVIAATLLLLVDVAAMSWVGMWLGLQIRRREHLAGAVLTRVMVFPALLALFCSTWLGWYLESPGPTSEFVLLVSCWVGVGLLADLILVTWSRTRLLRRFRDCVASEEGAQGHLGRLGRRLGAWFGRRRVRQRRA